jgi:selenide,water dikinase
MLSEMLEKRFIDLAIHGGCSKKLGANELQVLLSGLAAAQSSIKPQSFSSWLDFGRFDLGEKALISNVDVILPMVLSPADFGEIAVAHILSDIYASGATPLFALNILGIAEGMNSDDEAILEMLISASKKLEIQNVTLVGGHTIGEQADFYYGLAAVGIIDKEKIVTNEGASVGDALILTKPLGTSVASVNWRRNPHHYNKFQDVIVGMKQLNNVASKEMLHYHATACTDITGFGFLGHTHNLLKASRVSATIHSAKIPVYESIRPYVSQECGTRMLGKNFEYVKNHVEFQVGFSPLLEVILFDAQVSGGLLVSLPSSDADSFVTSLKNKGVDGVIIGEITKGDPGYIDIVF